ncbi:hypothetical protein GUITHDRAFT_100716 [Guillardia theta CCMP2712]|uniref:Single-stranded DNA binding protein Ssb-like OB fold domain-containing protein n=1 Tax=Guillardia theta (strain CCMP2712) TaxID=905079 RepID=L1JZW7_GUITC|nr:hypothetical protein GUITHDRAFT_100716 [Guillardia theta CCMP2712]EKX53745.1 hypothetical protein GUITHDRAFT_100716 [Guillardia theta CCMP2712]|eukprot:XP_005840725.1 hypothetical protein GUITHDRAFT_100716 [Guillardia theta CCMP2712]
MSGFKVGDVTRRSAGVSLKAKVVRVCVQGRAGEEHEGGYGDVLIGDETGCILLLAAGAELGMLTPGSSVLLRNVSIEVLHQRMRLTIGRWGSMEPLEPGLTCELENDLSSRDVASDDS